MILLITFLCFADDTSLYLVVDNEYEAADQLNKDIESIHQWSQKWLINSTLTK
jgi:nitrogen fixation protein FixH